MSKKQKKKNIYKLNILILFGVIIIAFFFYSPFFYVDNIIVNGNMYYEKQKIVEKVDINKEVNIFNFLGGSINHLVSFRSEEIEERVSKLPYVKSAKAKLKLPKTIIIDIVERKKAAYIKHLGNNLIIDSEGYIIDSMSDEQIEGLDLIDIRGIYFESYILGEKLKPQPSDSIEQESNNISIVLQSDSATNLKLNDKIDWIELGNGSNVILCLDNRVTVNLGIVRDLDLIRYRVELMRHIFYKNITSVEKGLLDFTKGENPSFIPQR